MRRNSQRLRVLVIDDEEIVGRTIERLIRSDHEVERETDPREALARLTRGEVFDVILCDFTMLNLTGMQVYEHIARLNEKLASRIVFLTGALISENIESFLRQRDNLVLQKPFTLEELLSAIVNSAAP